MHTGSHQLKKVFICTFIHIYYIKYIQVHSKYSFFSLPSQTKQTIEKLQNIVSSDGRFRNLRDALHRCDPPCIPYLGMYLTDLSFIEEGTPNFTEDGLLNFSKMRMVSRTWILYRILDFSPFSLEFKIFSYILQSIYMNVVSPLSHASIGGYVISALYNNVSYVTDLLAFLVKAGFPQHWCQALQYTIVHLYYSIYPFFLVLQL